MARRATRDSDVKYFVPIVPGVFLRQVPAVALPRMASHCHSSTQRSLAQRLTLLVAYTAQRLTLMVAYITAQLTRSHGTVLSQLLFLL